MNCNRTLQSEILDVYEESLIKASLGSFATCKDPSSVSKFLMCNKEVLIVNPSKLVMIMTMKRITASDRIKFNLLSVLI